jgi:tRNA (guanine37-N1)-methyltransferase
MHVHILTLFPGMFRGPLSESILKRAQESGLLEVSLYDIRSYTHDRHHVVDDYQYGGGSGMVLKPDPVFEGVEAVQAELRARRGEESVLRTPIILLSPTGRKFSQGIANELTSYQDLILISGHYEGVDARVEEYLVTDVLSIGDYLLTGGELPAMVVLDAVARLLPGVINETGVTCDESFTTGILQHPVYTRPPVFQGLPVPATLLSGNHVRIARWRRRRALLRTRARRPDLLGALDLGAEDCRLLEETQEGEEQ